MQQSLIKNKKLIGKVQIHTLYHFKARKLRKIQRILMSIEFCENKCYLR